MAKKTQLNRKDLAQSFGMLSDPTRLGILEELSNGPKNVSGICDALKLKQPTVSHHLGLLRMGRMVTGTRSGKSVVYETNTDHLKELEGALKVLKPGK